MLMASNNPMDYWGYMSDEQRQQDVMSGNVSQEQAQKWYGGMWGGGTIPSWLNSPQTGAQPAQTSSPAQLGDIGVFNPQQTQQTPQYTPPTFQQGDTNPWKNIGLAGLGGLLTGSGNVAGLILGGLGAQEQMGLLSNTQQNYSNYINSMTQQLPGMTEFKPYTVTSGLGSTQTNAQGGVTSALSNQQQGVSNTLNAGAMGAFGRATTDNAALANQSGMLGGMLSGYQSTPMNQYNLQNGYNTGYNPTNVGINNFGAQQLGYNGAPQFGGQANALSGSQFNVGGLGPTNAQQFSGQAQAATGPNVNTNLGPSGASRITDTASALGYGNNQLANFGQGMLTQGMNAFQNAGQAGAQAQGLGNQFSGLTGQAAQSVMQDVGSRANDIYSQIRATQTPEEQRAASALEQRLAAQGRLGVQTNEFGGTPEQFAQEKAIAEARNSAMVQARDMAAKERGLDLSVTQGLGGLASNFMGQASDLQSAAQSRAAQLSQMGMSASQINSQLQSEGLGRALQAGEYNRQGTMLNDQLTQSDFNRRLATGEFGMKGQELASRLADAETSRNLSTMGFNRDTLGVNSQLQNEALQRALQSGQYGREGMALASQLASQQQSRNMEAMGFNRDTMGFNSQLQNEALSRAISQGQFGIEAQRAASQMSTEDLARQISSGAFGMDQARLMDQLTSSAQDRDIQRGQFDLAQQLQAQGMRSSDIQNILALAGGQQSALAQNLALQQGYGQLGMGMLSGSYMPYEQMRADFAMGNLPAQLAAAGQETGAGLLAQLGLGGLAEQTKLSTLQNNMLSQLYQTAGGLMSGSGSGATRQPGAIEQLTGGTNYLKSIYDSIFGGGSSGGASTPGSNPEDYMGQQFLDFLNRQQYKQQALDDFQYNDRGL